MDETRCKAILHFLETVDRLKSVYRSAYTDGESRHESDAEHTWHVALFALMFHQELSLEVDIAHTLELIIVHDLVEIYAGDTPAYDVAARRTKRTRETAAANRLFVLLPHDLGSDNHWNEESGSLLDAVPRIRA